LYHKTDVLDLQAYLREI